MYTGETLSTCSQMQCKVVYKRKECTLPMIVAEYDGKPTFLGRNWLEKLNLDWSEIFSLHTPGSIIKLSLCRRSRLHPKQQACLFLERKKTSLPGYRTIEVEAQTGNAPEITSSPLQTLRRSGRIRKPVVKMNL